MKNLTLSLLMSAATTVLLIGCSSESGNSGGPNVVNTPPPDTVPDDNGHAHASEGPHHGELIELGDDEYHAEWVVSPHQHEADEGHEEVLSIFILDGSAKKAVPIDATDVTINLTHDGKPEQFKLAAMPTENDPAGMSSRFTSSDEELLAHFHEEEIAGTLVVTIDGKSYRGKIAHEHHDHGAHSHEN